MCFYSYHSPVDSPTIRTSNSSYSDFPCEIGFVPRLTKYSSLRLEPSYLICCTLPRFPFFPRGFLCKIQFTMPRTPPSTRFDFLPLFLPRLAHFLCAILISPKVRLILPYFLCECYNLSAPCYSPITLPNIALVSREFNGSCIFKYTPLLLLTSSFLVALRPWQFRPMSPACLRLLPCHLYHLSASHLLDPLKAIECHFQSGHAITTYNLRGPQD